jgi:hypothetical protein
MVLNDWLNRLSKSEQLHWKKVFAGVVQGILGEGSGAKAKVAEGVGLGLWGGRSR